MAVALSPIKLVFYKEDAPLGHFGMFPLTEEGGRFSVHLVAENVVLRKTHVPFGIGGV